MVFFKPAGPENGVRGKKCKDAGKLFFMALPVFICLNAAYAQKGVLSGDLKMWHKVTITFIGPNTSERGIPNPFTDYRLNVTFTHPESGTTLLVPGYYAADGDAANTSAESGDKWRVHLSPSAAGTWKYSVSFRKGTDIHFNASPTAGESAAFMDNETGSFQIGPTDKVHPDMRSKGWLQWVGGHYPRHKGNGEYMLKQGVDGPETLLRYGDFDNTIPRMDYLPHVVDWKPGDPTWKGDKGKGLIGQINYLASEGMNAFGMITNSWPNGDDEGLTFPYVDNKTPDRIDVSKCDQWCIVFDHGTRMGMLMHYKMTETENECGMDNCAMGRQRTLYFRELIARFGHNPAICWNLGEENGALGSPNQTTEQRLAMAEYFWTNDPYQHLIVLHNGKSPDDMYGTKSKLTGWSLQNSNFAASPNEIRSIIQKSVQTGKPWVVSGDEIGGGSGGIVKDANSPKHDLGRIYMVWGIMMVGGWGAEMYLRNDDWVNNEFRTRDKWWDYPRYALQFFRNNRIPFWDMKNNDALTSSASDWVLAKEGAVYVIYLREGGTTTLNVGAAAVNLKVKWYNPRAGGELLDGSVTAISGSGNQPVGNPPGDPTLDWVVLVGGDNITAINNSGNSASGLFSPEFTYYRSADKKVNGVIRGMRGNDNAEIAIFDIRGRKMYSRSFAKITSGELRFVCNTSALRAGFYIVNCRAGNLAYRFTMNLDK